MSGTLFTRLLGHSVLVLATLLVAGGLFLDGYLVERAVQTQADTLTRFARLTALTVETTPRPALQQAIVSQGRAARVRLTVIAMDGTVLADSESEPHTMDNHGNRPEIATALGGQPGRSARVSPTLGVEMLYVALPGAPVVRAALPLAAVHELIWDLRRRTLLAALPAVAVALALAYLLSRLLSRRFHAMGEFAARLAEGDYQSSLPIRGNDPLAHVERSLVRLREELAQQIRTLEIDRQRLVALVDGLPEAVVLLDGSGRLVVANQPARELFRLPAETLKGLPGAEVLREPRILEALDQLAERPAANQPFRVTWPEPRRELEVALRPLPDIQGRPGALVVLRDVTRQAHLERVRTDFIANLSHELRTPLTAIRGAAETLMEAALDDPEATQRFSRTIQRHSLRLESLLGDVSQLARIESGASPLDLTTFDARAPLASVAELFALEAEKKGVELEVRVPDTPVEITSDAGKVESVLVNLVQNAVRYTPAAGRVVLGLEQRSGGVRFWVADTGIGIPPADLPRVTERFYRVDPSRSRAEGGTGLGLSIVRHLVETLGGDLTLTSEAGQGTTARVTLGSLPPRPAEPGHPRPN